MASVGMVFAKPVFHELLFLALVSCAARGAPGAHLRALGRFPRVEGFSAQRLPQLPKAGPVRAGVWSMAMDEALQGPKLDVAPGKELGNLPAVPEADSARAGDTSHARDTERTPPKSKLRPGGRGGGRQGSRGRSDRKRYPVLVLENPMFLRRRSVVVPTRAKSAPAPVPNRPPDLRLNRGSKPKVFSGSEADGPLPDVAPVDPSKAELPPGTRPRFKEKPKVYQKQDEQLRGKKERRPQGRKQRKDLRDGILQRPTRKKGKKLRAAVPPPEPTGPPQVVLGANIMVGDLAAQLRVGVAEVIKELMKMGVLASVTQSVAASTAEELARAYGAEVTSEAADNETTTDVLGVVEEEDEEGELVERPPVLAVLGHVDHGKTTLLDALRSAHVAGAEAGGITQQIGAYLVTGPGGERLTILDTPGHAAFDAMRARGADVTDMVILVVAADDGVMPQTIQSIEAAKSAGVPVLVAFTKTDKAEADTNKAALQLLEHGVVLEEFGGDVLSAKVSGVTGEGIPELFEQVALVASILDLRANPARPATGRVLEAQQVPGRGAVATVLVQRGTLRIGDVLVAGNHWGRVRGLKDDAGRALQEATPSMAVEVAGLTGLPEAGDQLIVTPDEKKARELAETRLQRERESRNEASFATSAAAMQEAFLKRSSKDELPIKVLDFIVKADTQGAAEALAQAIQAIEAEDDKLQVKTRVLRFGAGAVTNEDILLASVSKATVIGFGARASVATERLAQERGIEIRSYDVVYDALDDVHAQLAQEIRPPPAKQLGTLVGKLNVKQIFKIGSVGKVAGAEVVEGFIRVGSNIRILRGNLIVYEGKLRSLRKGTSEAEQVDAFDDCGISFDDYQGMEVGDRVEVYAARDSTQAED